MSEPEWEAWHRGEARCPYCAGLSMAEFANLCDCSRYNLETTGKPLVMQVTGQPETAIVVPPTKIVTP